jgi:hypothetical protein
MILGALLHIIGMQFDISAGRISTECSIEATIWKATSEQHLKFAIGRAESQANRAI